MKKIMTIVAVLAVCLAATSCKISIDKESSNKNLVSKTLEVGDFICLTLNGHGDIILTQDSVTSVILEAEEKDIDKVGWENNNGELRFGYRGTSQQDDRKIVLFDKFSSYCVRISAPDIENIHLSGSGDIKVGHFKVDHPIGLSVAGSGDIETEEITAPEINASIAGSGDIELKARNVERVILSVAGSGDIEARFVDCGDVEASVAGSGDIELKGNARSLQKKVAGSGKIDDKGLITKE